MFCCVWGHKCVQGEWCFFDLKYIVIIILNWDLEYFCRNTKCEKANWKSEALSRTIFVHPCLWTSLTLISNVLWMGGKNRTLADTATSVLTMTGQDRSLSSLSVSPLDHYNLSVLSLFPLSSSCAHMQLFITHWGKLTHHTHLSAGDP